MLSHMSSVAVGRADFCSHSRKHHTRQCNSHLIHKAAHAIDAMTTILEESGSSRCGPQPAEVLLTRLCNLHVCAIYMSTYQLHLQELELLLCFPPPGRLSLLAGVQLSASERENAMSLLHDTHGPNKSLQLHVVLTSALLRSASNCFSRSLTRLDVAYSTCRHRQCHHQSGHCCLSFFNKHNDALIIRS